MSERHISQQKHETRIHARLLMILQLINLAQLLVLAAFKSAECRNK